MVDPAGHAESRNVIESILRHVPGFRGYLEKEYRRESDEMTRSFLTEELQLAKQALDDFQRSLVDSGQLDDLPACERVRNRLDTLQSRLRGAMQGYSGFFDFVRVDEARLDQVYQHDLELIADVQAVREAATQLASAVSPEQPRLDGLRQQVEQLHRRFDQRAKILEGWEAKA